MDLYNNKLTRRLNRFLRPRFVAPGKRRRLHAAPFSLLCNNCTGGMILHDLGLPFNSPTVNLFFHSLDFFEFIEHFDDYIDQPLIQIPNPRHDANAPDYPVAELRCEGLKTLELHFLHYPDFETAEAAWNRRKARLCRDRLFVMFTFMGMPKDEALYRRAENLPVNNKVFFVNHPVDPAEFPSFFYIRGFENQIGLGQLGDFCDLLGHRFYDQFDYVSWFNRG